MKKLRRRRSVLSGGFGPLSFPFPRFAERRRSLMKFVPQRHLLEERGTSPVPRIPSYVPTPWHEQMTSQFPRAGRCAGLFFFWPLWQLPLIPSLALPPRPSLSSLHRDDLSAFALSVRSGRPVSYFPPKKYFLSFFSLPQPPCIPLAICSFRGTFFLSPGFLARSFSYLFCF